MKKILEVGCGEGFYSFNLSKHGRVIGIDISAENIHTAKSRYPNLDFRVMSLHKLNFPDHFFDEVHAYEVLEHVDNLTRSLTEIRRVLKPDGLLHISVPDYRSERLLTRIRPSYFSEIHHVRSFSRQDFVDIARKFSFSLKQIRYRNFFQLVELVPVFLFTPTSATQLGIGNWRSSPARIILHIFVLFFDPLVLKTPLVFIPVWLVTLPVGWLVNQIGCLFIPKTIAVVLKKK